MGVGLESQKVGSAQGMVHSQSCAEKEGHLSHRSQVAFSYRFPTKNAIRPKTFYDSAQRNVLLDRHFQCLQTQGPTCVVAVSPHPPPNPHTH